MKPDLFCFVGVRLNKLVNKHSSCRCFETSWRSCDVVVMDIVNMFSKVVNHTYLYLILACKQRWKCYEYHAYFKLNPDSMDRISQRQKQLNCYLILQKESNSYSKLTIHKNKGTHSFPVLILWSSERFSLNSIPFFMEYYSDVILSPMASQITGVSIVCTTVC